MTMFIEESEIGAFDGSHVVACRGILSGTSPRVSFPLFTAGVTMQRIPLVISYTFRRHNEESEICLSLKFRSHGELRGHQSKKREQP